MKRILIGLALLIGVPVFAQNGSGTGGYGSVGPMGGPTNGLTMVQTVAVAENMMATNPAAVLQAVHSTNSDNTSIATNGSVYGTAIIEAGKLPAWTGSNYIFLSPNGTNSWSVGSGIGLTREVPISNPIAATVAATNLMMNNGSNGPIVINLMPGTYNSLGLSLHLPDNVWLNCEQGSTYVWTNPALNDISGAGITVGNNSQIFNLNLFNPDAGNSCVPIGEGSNDKGAGYAGKTNWIFWNLNLVSYGTALHWENTGSTQYVQGIFVNPIVKANRACVLDKRPNLHITFINRNFTTVLFTNNIVANTKTLAVFDVEGAAAKFPGPAFTLLGGIDHYGDAGTTNSVCDVWGGNQYGIGGITGTNVVIYMANSTLDNTSTNPLSFDFWGSTNGNYIVQDTVHRQDTLPLTITNTFGQCMVYGVTTIPSNSPIAGVTNVLRCVNGVKSWVDNGGAY